MRTQLLLLLATGVLLPLTTGCSSSRVVRGQNPAIEGVAGDYCEADCECDECSRRDLRRARRMERRMNRPEHVCTPYHIPHDLSYPSAGDQFGVVQYPYYTHKGPDCFFYDSDGQR
ncbi:MAG: hypothetical protein ACK5HA_01490 [Planctomycetaceae bacterium]|jgi:hypothetical protein